MASKGSTPAAVPAGTAQVRSQLVSTAHVLIPVLRQSAEQSERDRRLTNESVQAMRSSGVLHACAPRRTGGFEGGARTLIEVVARLSRGDGSAGWVAMIANCTSWAMGLLPDDARVAVYGDDPRRVSISQFGTGGSAVAAGDSYRINGKWPFASGSHHADWTISGILVQGSNGEPLETRWALLPLSKMEILDTWHVAGMVATGSNTLVAQDLVIPKDWTIPFDTFKGYEFARWHDDEPTYRASVSAVACLALVAPLWGMAEAAWDLTLEEMHSGRAIKQWNYDDARKSPGWRTDLGEARAAIDTGQMHLLRAADDIDVAAQENHVLDLNERARIRNDQAVATKSLRSAVDLLMDLNGARAFALSNPLQRIWRDFGTASRHGLNSSPLNREVYAHSLTGLNMNHYADRI